MVTKVLRGGDKLERALTELSEKVRQRATLRVGFFEGQEYPDGTPVAYVAAIQEFGAKVEVEAHEQTIYRSIANDGSFNKNGKFVKAAKSNFATTHHVDAHDIFIPPRPFMRMAIDEHQHKWSGALASALKQTDYDVNESLNVLGEVMSDQVRDTMDSIGPPNAPSTARKKGFNKPLVDTGQMRRAVSHEVNDGN